MALNSTSLTGIIIPSRVFHYSQLHQKSFITNIWINKKYTESKKHKQQGNIHNVNLEYRCFHCFTKQFLKLTPKLKETISLIDPAPVNRLNVLLNNSKRFHSLSELSKINLNFYSYALHVSCNKLKKVCNNNSFFVCRNFSDNNNSNNNKRTVTDLLLCKNKPKDDKTKVYNKDPSSLTEAVCDLKDKKDIQQPVVEKVAKTSKECTNDAQAKKTTCDKDVSLPAQIKNAMCKRFITDDNNVSLAALKNLGKPADQGLPKTQTENNSAGILSCKTLGTVKEPQKDVCKPKEEPKKDVCKPKEELKKDVCKPKEEPKKDVCKPKEEPKKDVCKPKEQPKKDVCKPKEQPKKDVCKPKEQPKKDVCKPKEEPKKDVCKPKEQPKKDVCKPKEQPKKDVCKPKEEPKKDVCKPKEEPKKDVCKPKEQLKKDVCKPKEEPKKDVCKPKKNVCKPKKRICKPKSKTKKDPCQEALKDFVEPYDKKSEAASQIKQEAVEVPEKIDCKYEIPKSPKARQPRPVLPKIRKKKKKEVKQEKCQLKQGKTKKKCPRYNLKIRPCTGGAGCKNRKCSRPCGTQKRERPPRKRKPKKRPCSKGGNKSKPRPVGCKK